MSTYKCANCRSRHTAAMGDNDICCYVCGHVGPHAHVGQPWPTGDEPEPAVEEAAEDSDEPEDDQ